MILNVRVRTNSRPARLIKVSDFIYEADLKSSPENNKANEELVKLFRKEFKGSVVRLVRGKTSKKKVIKIGN